MSEEPLTHGELPPVSVPVLPDADDYAAISAYNTRYNDCNCMAYDAEECISVAEGYGPNIDVAMLYHEPCDCACHEQYAKVKQQEEA